MFGMSGIEQQFEVPDFEQLHTRIVGLLGHLAPVDITQAVGRRLDKCRILVSATVDPPTITESHTYLEETPHGEMCDTITNVIKVIEPEVGPDRVVVEQKRKNEKMRQPAGSDGVPVPRKWEELPDELLIRWGRIRVLNRVRTGISKLLLTNQQILDSDGERR